MEGRKRSQVWNFFTEVKPDQAKCGFCSTILSTKGGSTANCIRHLKRKHPGVDDPRFASRQSTVEENSERCPEPSPELPSRSETHPNPRASGSEKLLTIPCQGRKQNTMSSYLHKPLPVNKSKLIDEQVVRMVTKEFQPFSIVEETEFKKLLSMLNPGYKLPSRKTLSKSLIPQLFEKTKENVKQSLACASAVSISTDGWTSNANQSYIAVTAHFIDNDCTLQSYLLECFECAISHTAENLANELKRVFVEWNISNKVSAVTTDNAANIIAAIKIGEWCHLRCFAHSLNLVVQSAIKEIACTHKKVKRIVEFFKRSPQATQKLLNMQKQMGCAERKLKQDVPTRWNSTYEMFERIIDVKDSLLSTLGLIQADLDSLSPKEWVIIESACDILKIFYIITVELSGEAHVTLSKVTVLCSAMKDYIAKVSTRENLPIEIKKMISIIADQISTRFQDIEENPLIAESTILDPRFKKQAFSQDHMFQTAYNSIAGKASSITLENEPQNSNSVVHEVSLTEKETDILWRTFDSKIKNLASHRNPVSAGIIELDRYLQEPYLDRGSDPLLWWRSKSSSYPRLFQIMKRRLCILSTSVACERIFSKAGQIVSERRCNLSSSKVSQVLFLNANLK